MATTRKYELKERARRQEETRRRITEATVELHEEVGPAATTIAEIARRAGVQRLTVYKHFPDEASLFAACGGLWSEGHPTPDPSPWGSIDDPDARTRTALRELYAYYAANERMLGQITRDAQANAALRAEFEGEFGPYLADVAALLMRGRGLRGRRRERVGAQLDLVLRFEGWRLLGERASDAERAAELAADLVRAAAAA